MSAKCAAILQENEASADAPGAGSLIPWLAVPSMTARNLKQQRSRSEPLAQDELKQFIARAVANNQQDEMLHELELQRPDKASRTGPDGWSPTSLDSDTPSTREFLLLNPVDHSKPHGPPPPVPVSDQINRATTERRSGRGGRGSLPSSSASASAGYGRASPGSVQTLGTGASDTETVTSSIFRSPADDPMDEYVLPAQPVGNLPKGIPSLAKWGKTLLVLPKYKDKKWSYLQILKEAWNDRDILSYLKWIKNTYFQEAQNPKGGKASDLAAFILACDYPVDRRFQEIHSFERVFVD